MSKKLKPGDVLEIETPGELGALLSMEVPAGFIYVAYIGKHPEYGDGIAVIGRIFPTRQRVNQQMFEDCYVTFYPASRALRERLVSAVGRIEAVPDVPTSYRRPGAVEGRTVVTWIVTHDGQDEVRWQLSDSDLRLPIAGVWNHAFLIERVAVGWRPELEGAIARGDVSNRPLTQGTAEKLLPAEPKCVRHYLYFPSEAHAQAAAVAIRMLGMTVVVSPAAMGDTWLALAKQEAGDYSARASGILAKLEEIARVQGGEYDGREAEL